MSEHFPTPWKIDPHSFSVYAADVPRGSPRVADMRGWGYLTGKGSGALGLSDDEGIAAQKANAELIVKAVNSHDALVKALSESRSALIAFKDAVEASQKMNGREYIGLGIQINDAIGRAYDTLSRVGGEKL